MTEFKKSVITILDMEYDKNIENATVLELYHGFTKAAIKCIGRDWGLERKTKTVCYFSAEFLIGRLIFSNLLNLGLLEECNQLMKENGRSLEELEEVEDAALGNGGLGRLAACFLDSGATNGITLNGYGIRYQYGIFKQYFEKGFQMETADDWTAWGDPWSFRKEEEKVRIDFKNQSVYAVPYDTPVIGYGGKTINTLRLWQAEPLEKFNFKLFNDQKYDKAVKEKNAAEAITQVLYPNDSTDEGKKLRLKQQYFFASASLQDILKKYKKVNGTDFTSLGKAYGIQLNDTHPVVAIPELIRLLMEEEVSFSAALDIAKDTFAYTNHTVMAEALEKWDDKLFKGVIPRVHRYVVLIQKALGRELTSLGISEEQQKQYAIIDKKHMIHMARLAIFATHSTNGVARLHTEIIKKDVLKEWYQLYPDRFNNKTNGITQRRWLALCNQELSEFITRVIGSEWITNLDKLKELESFVQNVEIIKEFQQIKQTKKKQLADYILKKEGISIQPEFIFDVQVKRLHEYKRQLLNAFSIVDIYFRLKDKTLKNFQPTCFIFGAKAAPGYVRAKGIIKYINEISKMIAEDPEVKEQLQVVFVSNYNVSYAEKIIPAADISEQISTAGTEASGTGNMKFMLNGAVTLGTYDGANIEIVEEAGEENNYIFGARVEEIEKVKNSYNPKKIYNEENRIKRVLDTLIDGTFDDGGTGMFRELYTSILEGASWHSPDHYFILLDFISYCQCKEKVNQDYVDLLEFRKKCFINMANGGKFSSDRTIKDYCQDVWGQ